MHEYDESFAVTSRQKVLELKQTPVNPVKRLWEQKGIKFPGESILPNSSLKSCTATSTSTASVATSVSDDCRRGKFVPRNGDYKKLKVVLIDTEKH